MLFCLLLLFINWRQYIIFSSTRENDELYSYNIFYEYSSSFSLVDKKIIYCHQFMKCTNKQKSISVQKNISKAITRYIFKYISNELENKRIYVYVYNIYISIFIITMKSIYFRSRIFICYGDDFDWRKFIIYIF